MATLFRATVMLTALVGAPAAWIYHGPLPPGAQRAVDGLIDRAQATMGWEAEFPSPVAQSDASANGYSAANQLPLRSAPRFETAATSAVPASVGQSSASPEVTGGEARPAVARQIEPLLAQLRGCGAAEYTLENWGSGGDLYRFRCSLPLGRNDDHARQFEAIANDPHAAVQQVLAEASAWQLARRSAPSRR